MNPFKCYPILKLDSFCNLGLSPFFIVDHDVVISIVFRSVPIEIPPYTITETLTIIFFADALCRIVARIAGHLYDCHAHLKSPLVMAMSFAPPHFLSFVISLLSFRGLVYRSFVNSSIRKQRYLKFFSVET